MICQDQVKHGAEPVIYQDEYWRARHADETNILGYVVLEARRHFLDLSEATAEEAASYGVAMAKVMAAVRKVTAAERVYTFSLGEAVPHFHTHLIPRTRYLPRRYRARGILSYPLSPSADPSLKNEVVSRLKSFTRRHQIQPFSRV